MYADLIDKGNYSKLSNVRFTKNETQLIVEADIHIDGDMIGCNNCLEVIPVLSGAGERLELPFVLVNGMKRHRAYRQMNVPLGRSTMETAYHIYREMVADRDLYCRYQQKVPYQNWMEHAVLLVREK